MGGSIKLEIPKVAVTGGIAVGKSTVCHVFEQLGASVISADHIVHQLLVPTTPLGKQIIALLGDSIVVGDAFSRKNIAQLIFCNPELLEKFEQIIHPEVLNKIETAYQAACQKNAPLFVAEVPLLYEAHWEHNFDAVVLVVCSETVCQKRFARGEQEYLLRSRRLMPLKTNIHKADYVVENHGSLEDLFKQIQFIYRELKENI